MDVLMFERKVHAVGNSLLLALPSVWCRNNGLAKKSKVNLILKSNGDSVSANIFRKRFKACSGLTYLQLKISLSPGPELYVNSYT